MNLNATQQTNRRGTRTRAPLNRNLNHALNPFGAGRIKVKIKSRIKIETRAARPQLFKATHEL